MLAGAKKVALMCLGTAVQKPGEALKDEQEVLGHFADIATATCRRRPCAATPTFDVTPKAGSMAGKRMQMEEVALYTVRGGKVAREEFFYSMG